MSGGGKGGSQTTRVQLPGFIEDAAQRAVARGEQVGQVGYVPYMGPDVAAFTPQQRAAFAGSNQAASAFGLPSAQGTGLPAPETFAGGVQGYSSFPLYEQALAQLEATRPGQFEAINSFSIDPVTGAVPTSGLAQANPAAPGAAVVYQDGNQGQGGAGGYGGGGMTGTGSGYTGFGDMFDGGGPGASGDTFSGGGLLSDAANRWG